VIKCETCDREAKWEATWPDETSLFLCDRCVPDVDQDEIRIRKIDDWRNETEEF